MIFKSNLFRKNGYTSLKLAYESQGYSLSEIAQMLKEPQINVTYCLRDGYHKTNWKTIVKVAELLGVPREHYIKGEHIKNLPKDVQEFYDLLTGSVIQYPKKEKNKRVTGEDRAIICRMNKEGKSNRVIAAHLGISDQAVGYQLRKEGIHRNLTQSDKDEIKGLYLSGKSYKQIKAATGRSAATISRTLKSIANRNKKPEKITDLITDARPFIKRDNPKPLVLQTKPSNIADMINMLIESPDLTSATITTKTTKITIERG
jgi:uncharacterized protein YerC